MIMYELKFCRRWRSIILLFVSSFVFGYANGQSNFILYGFDVIPQSNYLNPAFQPAAKVVVGFPGLSNLDISYLNTAGAFNDFFTTKNGNDSLFLNLSKVISDNHGVDKINISLNQDLLFFGFKIKQSFLSFGLKQRVLVNVILPTDLIKLAWFGNAPYVGQTLDLSTTAINENHFFDYHVGLSIPITSKIHLGFRVHLLQGLSNIYTVNNKLQITTTDNSQNAYDMVASTRFIVNTAGLPDSTDFDPGTYFTNFKNIGFSFDLGADFKINDQISISASLLDLGSINFRGKTKNYQSQEDSVHFSGFNEDVVNSGSNPFENIGDSLSDLLHVTDYSQNYRAKIPMRLIVGGQYFSVDHKNRASVLFSGRFYPGYFEPAVSLAFDRTISKHFSFKLSYTYIRYDPVYIGMAFALNVKPFQFYMYTDNILGVARWDKQRFVQLGFGLNIQIPDKKNSKRIPPMIKRMIKSAKPEKTGL